MKYGLLITVLGAALFLTLAGRFLVRDVSPEQADLIVPLAGETERIEYAIELYNEGFGTRLGLTTLPLKTSGLRRASDEFAKYLSLQGGVPESQLKLIRGVAYSTKQEAENILAYAHSQGLESVLIVTSAWHTRRSALIVEDVFATSDIKVTVVPSPTSAYQAASWWSQPKSRADTLKEYSKLLVYVLDLEHFFVPENGLTL